MTTTRDTVLRSLTVIIGTVVALTFLFGFGNVLGLGLRLGVPPYVAPLVAPAVDLSVLGLLVGTRHLALHGATPDQLRPAQRLLMFASIVTLALNVAEPVCAGQFGKAAFDAVGPLLLIGWAEVGPNLLQAIYEISEHPQHDQSLDAESQSAVEPTRPSHENGPTDHNDDDTVAVLSETEDAGGPLLAAACRLDTEHWAKHQ
ncbi:hypothetical protein [Saccharopolyspora gloriosae]|uniref:hypothetical protein n=1 Tax=Saccharopolyspora gloriosae TaxID=455344 RepID=UPI001FB57F8E|nr:hypothetical protein [Saccharopolyspora gloriosae]